jgi:hypothetical protein
MTEERNGAEAPAMEERRKQEGTKNDEGDAERKRMT